MKRTPIPTWALCAVGLVLSLALAGTTVPLAQAASAGKVKVPGAVSACTAVPVKGRVGKGHRKVRVQIRRPGGRWSTAATTKASRSGRFHARFLAPTSTGSYVVRALAPRVRRHRRVVTPAVPLSVGPAGAGGPTAVECQVIRLVNQVRAQHGCKPVTPEPHLTLAARRHSADMAKHDKLDHTGFDGSSPSERISAAGYHWRAWGENIAYKQDTPAEVMHDWMNSPPHRANILTCIFTELGVGLAPDSNGYAYWTQDFGDR